MALAVALLLCQAPSVAADVTAPRGDERFTAKAAAAAVVEAAGKARHNDWRGVVATLAPVIGTAAFATLPDEQRYWGHALLAAALFETSDFGGASTAYRHATEFRVAAGNDWRMRFWAAAAVENRADAIGSMTILSRRWPATLNSILDRVMFDLQRQIRNLPNRDALLLEMLSELHRAPYQPESRRRQ